LAWLKLLIIAGPYEADRIRKAAVSAGFETVAVEPGDSLSGWITASRPDVIILAPQTISANPVAALDKVRAVPRARVPIFLVGEASEEEKLRPLADGFFVRPVAPGLLLQKAREALERSGSAGPSWPGAAEGEQGSGPRDSSRWLAGDPLDRLDSGDRSGPPAKAGTARTRQPTLRPLVAEQGRAALPAPLTMGHAPMLDGRSIEKGEKGEKGAGTVVLRDHLAHLAESIDADLDEEMRDVARAVGALRVPASTPVAAAPADPTPPAAVTAPPPATEPASNEVESSARSRGGRTDDLDGSHALAVVQRARIARRHALVTDGDYFQILDLPRRADSADIEGAYRQLAAELAPEALDPSVVADLQVELAGIHRVLGEARRFLGDDRLRQLYREHLPQEREQDREQEREQDRGRGAASGVSDTHAGNGDGATLA
jgi:hypothetical protein